MSFVNKYMASKSSDDKLNINDVTGKEMNFVDRYIASKGADDKVKDTTIKKISFVDRYIGSGDNIRHVKAKDTTGEWACYFIFVKSEKEKLFLEAMNNPEGTVDLSDFGEIIASCYGESPTDKVKQLLKDKYDFDV